METCIEEKIWPAVTGRGALDAREQEESRATFALPRHHAVLLTIVARFLRGDDVVPDDGGDAAAGCSAQAAPAAGAQ
jgi:hypothetical protein